MNFSQDARRKDGNVNHHPTAKRSEAEIIGDIDRVYGELSPENLTWDGEKSARAVAADRARLSRKLHGLFKELGRRINEIDAWEYVKAHR